MPSNYSIPVQRKYIMIGCDYSAQEPRVCTELCQDEKMLEAYRQDKDLYAVIASLAFGVSYEDCLEHYEDGSTNVEGKKRRASAKSIVLGVMYGRGIESIAEQLHTSKQKAKQIHERVMSEFGGLRDFIVYNEQFARENGYVETLWGRKRRLPDMQLDKYVFEYIGGPDRFMDPLDDDEDVDVEVPEVDEEMKAYYTQKLNKVWGVSQRLAIIEEARKDGIKITDNGGKIAQAQRQCTNSRVQGSSADMTKLAMIELHDNPRLQELGYRMLIPVHDEVIGEVPYQHCKEAGKLVEELMVKPTENLSIPFKCDCVYSKAWYDTEYNDSTLQELIDQMEVIE